MAQPLNNSQRIRIHSALALCVGFLFLVIPAVGQSLPDPADTTEDKAQHSTFAMWARMAASSKTVPQPDSGANLSPDVVSDDSSRPPAGSNSMVAIQATGKSRPDTRFKWGYATQQSLLFTRIMHTFNLVTEAGTRDALYGPWLNDYLHSVGELRGWSDSDTFMAPYVGHTLEGSVFCLIERQNDPKFRKVQWGDGRDYFHSVLRSLAFSAVWHHPMEDRSRE